MLKNKIKITAILIISIFILINPVVRAENEVNTNSSIQTETSNQTENLNQTEQTEQVKNTNDLENSANENTLKQGDVYLIGDNVNVDYIVDGNVFILGSNVNITSQIGGDVFVCGSNITIGESAYIHGSLFAVSEKITINGILYDLYSIVEDLTINGQILRDIRTASNTVNLNGVIKRNAYINCNALNFKQNENSDAGESSPVIEGNLNYSSLQEASIPEKAVLGDLNFKKIEKESKNVMATYLTSLAKFVATIVLVLKKLFKSFNKEKNIFSYCIWIINSCSFNICSYCFIVFGSYKYSRYNNFCTIVYFACY